MKTTNFFLIALIGFVLWSCNKDDNTPPQITIAAPLNSSIVNNTITIKTIVADNQGIKEVQFFIDGDLLTTVYEEPYQADWITTESSNGEHTVQCKAIDNSDNETLSESIQVTVANVLFTANFTNDWLCPDCGEGIIFISDIDGNLLAEATWIGNDSFSIKVPENLSVFPEKISVTIVDNNANSNVKYLTTYLDIPVGTSWTFGKNYPSPDYGNQIKADFYFQNIPNHEGYSFSSLWTNRSSPYSSISSPLSYYFYNSPMDFYLMLNTIDFGHQYIWFNDVTSGYYNADLSNLSNTISKTINMHGSSVGYDKYLYGYPTPGSRYSGSYLLDRDYDFNTTTNSLSVFYPPSTFSDYRTSLYFYDSENRDNYWYQSVYGVIPDSFEKVGADFEFISGTPNNFHISTTNTNFDEIFSYWKASSGNNYIYWNVYGPSDLTAYKLPNLSNSVNQNLPYVDRESMELYYSQIVDFPELNSYEERLNITYDPDVFFYDIVNGYKLRTKYFYKGSQKKAHIRDQSAIEEDLDLLFIR